MTGAEMLHVDDVVRRGLGVRRGESIAEAAARLVAAGTFCTARRAAAVLLNPKRDDWEAMRLAARLLERGKLEERSR